MMNYYSASTQGFYTSEVNEDNIPSDCIEITEEYKAYLLSTESSSKRIAPDDNGYPIIVDVIISDSNKIIIERAWRDVELIRADFELNKVQDSDKKAIGTVTTWREYRKSLRDWPQDIGFPDSSKRPISPV